MSPTRCRVLGTVIGSGYVLRTFRPHPVELLHALRYPHLWVATVGSDAAARTVAGALLWFVALWLAFSIAVTVLTLVPGRLGMLASAVASRVTPVLLRRVVIAAAGASILASPAAAFANTGGGSPAPSGASARAVPALPAPALPVSSQVRSLPPISLPTDPRPTDSRPTDPRPTDSAPTDPGPTDPAAATPGPARDRPEGDQLGTSQVTVRPGNSLWSIAAQRLGPTRSEARIEAEWPRWYAANRRLIGADPNLLLPGTKLRAPQPASTSTEK